MEGTYWMVLRHFRSEVPYSDMRRFRVTSRRAPAAYCSLIRRYLSNGHLFDFKTPEFAARFAVKMIAALVDRNFSVGALQLRAKDDQHPFHCPLDTRAIRLQLSGLSDYRSMNTVFGGAMRLTTLEMSLFEDVCATLVMTTDFLRMRAVQRLKTLKLQLVRFFCKC